MSRGRRRNGLGALLIAATLLGPSAAATTAQGPVDEDAALSQRIDRDQRVSSERATLRSGHVDIGPLFVDGRWTIMIHDDTAKARGGASVWRHPHRTVLRVTDAARLRVPRDRRYDFLHATAGTPVYVVPQTQDPDVVWVGWNTQDPAVMEAIDRGVTMTLDGVQGPGDLVVYLQSGSFSEPQVLWDSTADPRPIWVDVNTHSHANWVFSRPGVYLVAVTIAADLVDGSKATDSRLLRFAVGSATDPGDALAATWTGEPPASSAHGAAVDDGEGGRSSEAARGSLIGVVAVIVVAAIALTGGLAFVVLRGGAAKRRARAGAPDAEGK